MRADADATERSGGIGRNDTSALSARSTCMALVGDNTGKAFSALIAFLLMIAVVPNILGVRAASVHWGMVSTGCRCILFGCHFEGIAGQETCTDQTAELYQRIEGRHHHVIDTPRRNLV
jgi:hypothetical protein